MKVRLLREMTPDEVRRKLGEFPAGAVLDWETWLQVSDDKRVSTFASILRSWKATRPLPMRRPRAEASHDPPHIEDLLDQASQHLEALGDLTLTDIAIASSGQINALHGLWATFLKLPQQGTASCVGITKAIILLTNGRIGPAFDSIVRKKLGLKDRLKSSEEWVAVLCGISEDILAFEKRHGSLTDNVPAQLARYQVGRLYDMVLGPETWQGPVESPPMIGAYEKSPATCVDHDPRAIKVAERVADLIKSRLPDVNLEHVGSTSVPGCAGKGIVDLMVLYEPGRLSEVRQGLDALGFQKQTGRDPFPEERPMRIGSIKYDGIRFMLHAHVISSDSPDVAEFRTFRDRLLADRGLVDRYVALKRRIIGAGVTDRLEYCIRKGEFITGMLRSEGIGKRTH
jgi:GrpB-like predicted nucleotidyltransferase (UPF0157 family)